MHEVEVPHIVFYTAILNYSIVETALQRDYQPSLMVTNRKEKAMFKIFSRVAEALRAEADAADTPVWLRDPLAHPAIETMDSRALGDLPSGSSAPRRSGPGAAPGRSVPLIRLPTPSPRASGAKERMGTSGQYGTVSGKRRGTPLLSACGEKVAAAG
ncbi:hypothetical protein [Shinella granuli]|uniref:hypothetical protein n=1 Tax=Shinella granuli TaxID=323621 RepID=UPI0031EE64C5